MRCVRYVRCVVCGVRCLAAQVQQTSHWSVSQMHTSLQLPGIWRHFDRRHQLLRDYLAGCQYGRATYEGTCGCHLSPTVCKLLKKITEMCTHAALLITILYGSLQSDSILQYRILAVVVYT